ncbi:hypothetical protein GTO91_14035 [Heliobacterium undosum]|uniref:Uncharacterized protein n=1 Tax=Heliomicrobium undosum TaxID=121734 RepID=A0A845L7Q3_9FIRM|nr:hypothetical protein [Heliomicrobium undosum]MZP30834.1 hypothetical protein [Heliomicrobium undosum]
MNDCQFAQTVLMIAGKKIDFGHNIFDVYPFANALVVHLLDRPTSAKGVNLREQPEDNVYVLNKNGDIHRRINEITGASDLYVSVAVAGDELIVTNLSGIQYHIDRHWQVVGHSWTK